MKIGILGNGEVGSAIGKFYENPLIKDLNKDEIGEQKLDVLNVCIPYSKKFIDIVFESIKKNKPNLVIVHSTVHPGTTKRIFDKYPKIVHSPIRGIHPYLFEGVKTFVKFIGADDKKIGIIAKEHMEKIGLIIKLVDNSTSTELGKLLDTTYYGFCIAFHQFADDLCDKYDVDFEVVMTEFNKTYNEGYAKLGKKNVVRPVLFSPKKKIGGHCVVSNAEILKDIADDQSFLDVILKYK